MAKTRVILTGPLFDGQAAAAARDLTGALARDIAAIGAAWIRIEAHGFDKSGHGGTGKAAAGVEGPLGSGGSYTVRGGIRAGQYSWPWLEGQSRRNQTTQFSGYHTFRRTRQRMRRQVTPFAQAELEKYLAQMGGGEV
jgi:hypothetical protein